MQDEALNDESVFLNYRKIKAIREARGLTTHEKAILWALASREPNVWPSQQLIAEDCGMSLSGAKKAISHLIELGYLVSSGMDNRETLEYTVADEVAIRKLGGSYQVAIKGSHQEATKEETSKGIKVRSKLIHDAVIQRYTECYERLRGMEPIIDKLAHKSAWTIARHLPSKEEAVDLVDAAFEDSFFCSNLGQLHQIANGINKYRRPLRPQPKVFDMKKYEAELEEARKNAVPMPPGILDMLYDKSDKERS